MQNTFRINKPRRVKSAAGLLLVLTMLLSNVGTAFSKSPRETFPEINIETSAAADTYLRTELYFGKNKPDGSEVSEADWNKFLETEVTPRFPDGYTVLDGAGHFRDKDGKIIVEKSKVLVLLYPVRYRKTSDRKIQRIRQAYKQTFQQQSVLRLDFQPGVRVSF